MMREVGHAPFIFNCPDKEPLVTNENYVSNYVLDEYMRSDQDRIVNANGATMPVVYDYIENSCYYEGAENKAFGPYLDEKEFIELPSPYDQNSGSINEPYQKRYYFNPNNLPYNLEQSHSYGQPQGMPQSKIA